MSSFGVIVAAAMLLTNFSIASGVSVVVGDSIDFQCMTEKRGKVDYLPNFQQMDESGMWVSLFTGSNPRPSADLAKWAVHVDHDSVFHYRLKSASLADGGHYRCNNINLRPHPLSVFSNAIDCGTPTLGQGYVDASAFRPTCRVESSGPHLTGDNNNNNSEDTPPRLKWVVVGTDEESEEVRNLTADWKSETSEATLTESLSHEHHGKNISCVLDGRFLRPPHLDRPNCVLGPLNISFNARARILDESFSDECHNYELSLTGNPLPLAPLVDIRDVSGSVESGIELVQSGLVLRLRACGLTKDIQVPVTYDGVTLKTLIFLPAEHRAGISISGSVHADSNGVTSQSTSTSAGPVAAAVVVLLFLGFAAGVAFYLMFYHKKAKSAKIDEEAGMGTETDDGKQQQQQQQQEEKLDDEGVDVEKTTENDEDGDDVSKVKDADAEVKDADAKDADAKDADAKVKDADADVKDADAEAEDTLKAKLSALEDVEGVRMIDDSINEGKDDVVVPLGHQDDKVDV